MPSLSRRAIQAIVGRRDFLIDRCIRHQIARQLLAREAVERHIVAERAQHIIAIRPRRKNIVAVKAAGVCVADRIQPVHGLLLGIARRRQQPVDHLFIGIGGSVVLKRANLFRESAEDP